MNHPSHHIPKQSLILLTLFLFALLTPLFNVQAGVPDSPTEVLQFTAAGHVLGFENDSVYIAGGTHMLKVDFVGTAGVIPAADGSENQAFTRVTYNDLWPGVNLAYETAAGGIIESTWQLAPGSDPEQIRLRYNAPVEVGTDGSLKIRYETGWMQESAPIAWQQISGRRIPVQAAFSLAEAENGDTVVGFTLGQYNPDQPLLIDPVLEWTTFVGSTGYEESGGMTVDGSGNVYVIGLSTATWGTPVNAFAGGGLDAFVAKLNSAGALQWHTFLGSATNYDKGFGVAVDGSGNVYVTGLSPDTWGTPIVAHAGGTGEAFIAKLNSSGALQWNTFAGSTDYDEGNAITVDSTGNVYITGTSNASWGTPVNGFITASGAFAAKLDTNGALQWNTFMGSTGADKGIGIALDSSNNVYVTGESPYSWGSSPVNAHPGGGPSFAAIFAAKLNSAGTLQWNTFMGSASTDISGGIVVDGSGNVYVTGSSYLAWGTSPVNAFTTGGVNTFVTKLSSAGARTWYTFIGTTGGQNVWGEDIALDSTGNPHLAGYSNVTWGSPINAHAGGGTDAYAAKLNTSGVVQWNTFMGSVTTDEGKAIALDSSNNIYLSGHSDATWGSPIIALAGSQDVFVAKICAACFTVDTSAPAGEGYFTPTLQAVIDGATTTFDVTAKTGYTINTVSGCSGAWTGTNPYTTDTITTDCTVTGTFTINTYTLTYNAGTGGTVSGATPQTINYNNDGTSVTAVPNTGYHFVKWSDNVLTATRTDTSITADITVEAQFAINTYTLIYNAGTGGTVSGTTPQTINYNNDGTSVTAVPNTGYHFVKWSDNVLTATRTDTSITADITVEAQFAINTYTLTYNAGTGGTVSGTTPQTINYNNDGTSVTAVPDTGYHFVKWSDNVLTATRTDTSITADITVEAQFAINTYTLIYNHGAGGTVSGTTPQTVNHGDDGAAVTAVSDTDYNFIQWSDGVRDNPRTDTNVSGDVTVTAIFSDFSWNLFLPTIINSSK